MDPRVRKRCERQSLAGAGEAVLIWWSWWSNRAAVALHRSCWAEPPPPDGRAWCGVSADRVDRGRDLRLDGRRQRRVADRLQAGLGGRVDEVLQVSLQQRRLAG